MPVRKKKSPPKNTVSSSRPTVLPYTPPQLHKTKDWYIDFKAFDPISGTLKRKKYGLNFVKSRRERLAYAHDYIAELHDKLRRGWSPWIEDRTGKSLYLWDDVCNKYIEYLTRMYQDDNIREETLSAYLSFLNSIRKFNQKRHRPISYIYQFDRPFIIDLLNYVYIDLKRTPQTRDNYLGFCRTFSTYLVQNGFLTSSPAEGISAFGKRMHKKKNREIIPDPDLIRLLEYLRLRNPHYLLACYILFYCFIRPKEMGKLRIEYISLSKSLIYVPADISKNRRDGYVSLPEKVVHLMLDLKIFDHPGNFYLFSDKCRPGKEWRDEKQFRDFWNNHIRKDIKFPPKYKFYSLKDTGITSMLRSNHNPIDVRNQARHSSILMTEMYTPFDIQQANEMILRHSSDF